MFEYFVLELYKSQLAASRKKDGIYGYVEFSTWNSLYIIV